jgi:hypothetical protein
MFRFFLQKNHIVAGIIAGLIIPFVGYALLLLIFEQLESLGIVNPEGMAPNFRNRTSALVAIVLNVFPMNFYRKKLFYESMRGVVFPTVLYVILWIILFASSLFS